ncbi:MAG: hypothetical protein DRJ47_11345 [Thermoprotei archaeon]|nr:MAG: hypothetical protein DRJ47_11345 [Thermoprotei archaeon]
MTSLYTVGQMTSCLSAYLNAKGFETEVYSDKLLPARVPVYASKTKGKGKNQSTEEIIVDVITSAVIRSTDFFYPLHIGRTLADKPKELPDASSAIFFQYYFPRAKVYWAYPDYLNMDDEFAKFKKLCQTYRIGLFRVGKEKVVEDPSISSVPLIDAVLEKFELAIESIHKSAKKDRKTKELLKNVRQGIYMELDHHIERTNDYLIYYPEPEYKRREIIGRYEGRNISLTLIDKLSGIENLKYRKQLQELGANYRRRIEEDYDIAQDLIEELWNITGMKYPKFQKDFELVLLLDPHYRDHFLHQLHVFLLGCFIIDKLYEDEDRTILTFDKRFGNPIEDIWLFAATYHDYNYNIQNYNQWIQTFFKNTLFLDENPSQLRLDECYVKEDYMFKTKDLCDSFGLKVDRTTLLFFYDMIINQKNHGLLAALSLLKLFEQKSRLKTGLNKEALLQAARAIALHDEKIWMHFSGTGKNKFAQKKVLEKLKFTDDPLSFLLIFCDTIQEWGRVGRDYEETRARLDDVGIEGGQVWANISVGNEKAFNNKRDEIDRVKKFLLDKRFKIRLSSRAGLGSNIIERYMEGE